MLGPSGVLAEPLLHGSALRGAHYGRKLLMVLFGLIGLGFAAFVCVVVCMHSGGGQHLMGQEELFARPANSASVAQDELVDRALKAWPLHDTDLDKTMLGKGPPVPSCCACPGCDGCSSEPGVVAARRLTKAKESECKDMTSEAPLIKTLMKVEDRWLALEQEREKEVRQIQKKYREKQNPLLKERFKILAKAAASQDAKTGTPACKGFWCEALFNQDRFPIEDWDRPVLEYLKDITTENLKDEVSKGFRLTFHFADNPYFSNKELSTEYHTEDAPFYKKGEVQVKKIASSKIKWNPGRDVTVQKIKRKLRSKGIITRQEVEEPRSSFFRIFFRNFEPNMLVPFDLAEVLSDSFDSDQSEGEVIDELMDHHYEDGLAIRQQIIPFAARWYTAEAVTTDDEPTEDVMDFYKEMEKIRGKGKEHGDKKSDFTSSKTLQDLRSKMKVDLPSKGKSKIMGQGKSKQQEKTLKAKRKAS